jgi:hypothetical protein
MSMTSEDRQAARQSAVLWGRNSESARHGSYTAAERAVIAAAYRNHMADMRRAERSAGSVGARGAW